VAYTFSNGRSIYSYQGSPEEPYATDAITRTPPEDCDYVATLINPKDHRPVRVITDGYVTFIGMPVEDLRDFRFVGKGYYGDERYGPDDCLRSHTPGGVSKKSAGLGLMLYSGMALASALADDDAPDKPCIGSDSGRSDQADKFWRSAVEQELAEEIGSEANILRAAAVVENHLVLHLSEQVVEALETDNETIIGEIPAEIIMGIDLRACKSISLVRLLLEDLVLIEGISWKDVQDWIKRNVPFWMRKDLWKKGGKVGGPKENPERNGKPIRNQAAWKAFFGSLTQVDD